jgi:hypothetical protein
MNCRECRCRRDALPFVTSSPYSHGVGTDMRMNAGTWLHGKGAESQTQQVLVVDPDVGTARVAATCRSRCGAINSDGGHLRRWPCRPNRLACSCFAEGSSIALRSFPSDADELPAQVLRTAQAGELGYPLNGLLRRLQ